MISFTHLCTMVHLLCYISCKVCTFSTLCHSDDDAIENGAKCYDESGKSVGKFITRHGDSGLAILKLSDM